MREPWITEPGHYPDLDEADYHADPVVGGSLSSTGARTLLDVPARYAYEREHGGPASAPFDTGLVVHKLVLGVGAPVVEIDASDYKTKAARAAKDNARAAGKIPILSRELRAAEAMADTLHLHPIAGRLLARAGRPEQSFVARCPETEVMCRARTDWLPDVLDEARPLVVDYKTTVDASPDAFAGSVRKFGYHIQASWYLDVLAWLNPDRPRGKFVFVAQEKTPPFLVSVHELDEEALSWGQVLGRKARDLWRACTASGDWPGYPLQVQNIRLPGWQIGAYEAAYDRGDYDIDINSLGETA